MINELIKLATALDKMGYERQADRLDSIIKRARVGAVESDVHDLNRQVMAWRKELKELEAAETGTLQVLQRRKNDQRKKELEAKIKERRSRLSGLANARSRMDEFESKQSPYSAETWSEFTQKLDERADKADAKFDDEYDPFEPDTEGMEVGNSSNVDMILERYSLSEEHLVKGLTASDPYTYIYVPKYKGRPAWLIAAGPSSHRAFDDIGNPIDQERMVIREDGGGWEKLKNKIPRQYRDKEPANTGDDTTGSDDGSGAQAAESTYSYWEPQRGLQAPTGIVQLRNADNRVMGYEVNDEPINIRHGHPVINGVFVHNIGDIVAVPHWAWRRQQ